MDEDGEVWVDFGIASQPAFVFINQDGDAERVLGALGETAIAGRLDDLIQR